MKRKVLITSALPYANGPLHFGHLAGAYLPADIYARFERLMESDVLYICGSDEHGVAITLSASQAGRTPQDHVNLFNGVLQDFFKQLDISFDHYSRTTWPGHVNITQKFFLDLYQNGYIEDRITPQLYSKDENAFLADRYVIGECPRCGHKEARGDECPKCGASYEATDLKNPRSKVSGATLELKDTKHWFLRFDLFKDRLKEWIGKKDWKPNVLNFAQHYIDNLHPRAITRDSDWGIPVPLPGAEGKVFYVWFDAPIGYISATVDWAERKGDPKLWEKYWLDPLTEYVEFIGKDNIPFHAVFFPAMIMGQNEHYKLVDQLPANEFLNLEGRQFSKSEGWYIDLARFFEKFTTDQIRYYLAANAPETQDSEFTWADFEARSNNELLAKYGNLVQRTLVFIHDKLGGIVNISKETPTDADIEFLKRCKEIVLECQDSYAHFGVRKAAQLVMELAQTGNTYFDHQKPWTLLKNEGDKPRLEFILNNCLQCIKNMALISYPIIPTSAKKIFEMIGLGNEVSALSWDRIVGLEVPLGVTLPKPERLFAKIEPETIQYEIEMLKGKEGSPKSPKEAKTKEASAELPNGLITIDQFKGMDLRVGQIVTCKKVEKSEKLLQLQVDLGDEVRNIVSGIALSYPDSEALVGRKVLVLANLKPAKIMGLESQGMLLLAKDKDQLEFPVFVASANGSKVS